MAHVALRVTDLGGRKSAAIAALRPAVQLSLGEILIRVRDGQAMTRLDLWGTDLQSRADSFIALLDRLRTAGVAVELFHLLESESLPEASSLAVKVDLDMLERLVDAQLTESRYHASRPN